MATYAAMIEIMDDGIGEVIKTTKEKGIFDNTVFLFLSDNGATNEGDLITQLRADLSNTPFRSYKHWCFQGGTSSPLSVMYGGGQPDGKKGVGCHEFTHIIDLFPTCLDIASVKYPREFRNHSINAPEGRTIFPALKGKKLPKRDLIFEHQTSCGIISGDWKLVRANGKQPWELFHLLQDPFEQNDLSANYPEKVKTLEKKWDEWAEKQHVFPFEYRPWTERINYYKSLYPDQSGKD